MSLLSSITSMFSPKEEVATTEQPIEESTQPTIAPEQPTYAPEPNPEPVKMENPVVLEQQISEQMTDPVDTQRAFNHMWHILLKNEGGYTNTLNDGAGETKYGVTKRSYPHLDIKNLTETQAKDIFKQDFYDKVGGDRLASISEPLAMHVADMAYNAGTGTAIKLLHRAAGLPDSTKMSEDLYKALTSDQSLVDEFVKQRLAYYSTRANAPKFMKSWSNRVDHINKMYGNKSGMGGIFQAAKDLDTQAIVAGSNVNYLEPAVQFGEITPEEVLRLTADQQQHILADTPATIDVDRPTSSLMDVIKNTYNDVRYTYTEEGYDFSAKSMLFKAMEANKKAVNEAGLTFGDDLLNSAKEALSKVTLGIVNLDRNDVQSYEEFDKQIAELKEKYPDVKLPYEDSNVVRKMVFDKAAEVRKAYEDTESGRLIGGSAGETLTKLGHIVFGYFPASMAALASDPKQLAAMVVPGLGGSSLLTQSILAGASTAGVQGLAELRKKEAIGMEGSLQEALAVGAVSGVGVGAFGLLGRALGKLSSATMEHFGWSSKQAATKLEEAADDVLKALKEENLDGNNLYLQKTMDDVKAQAKEYRDNPLGEDYNAKVEFESAANKVHKDALDPYKRSELIKTKNRKFVDTAEYNADIEEIFADDIDDAFLDAFKSGNKEWHEFKKDHFVDNLDISKREDLVGKVNLQPKLKDGKPIEFPDQESLKKYLKSTEGKKSLVDGDTYIIAEDDGTLSVMKSLDVEPAETHSTRHDGILRRKGGTQNKNSLVDYDPTVEESYGQHKIVRKESADIEGLKAAPEKSLVSTLDIKPETFETVPLSKKVDQVIPKETLNKAVRTNTERLQESQAAVQKLSEENPELKFDLEDEEGVKTTTNIHKIRSEIKEETTSLKEFSDCITRPSVEGN